MHVCAAEAPDRERDEGMARQVAALKAALEKMQRAAGKRERHARCRVRRRWSQRGATTQGRRLQLGWPKLLDTMRALEGTCRSRVCADG